MNFNIFFILLKFDHTYTYTRRHTGMSTGTDTQTLNASKYIGTIVPSGKMIRHALAPSHAKRCSLLSHSIHFWSKLWTTFFEMNRFFFAISLIFAFIPTNNGMAGLRRLDSIRSNYQMPFDLMTQNDFNEQSTSDKINRKKLHCDNIFDSFRLDNVTVHRCYCWCIVLSQTVHTDSSTHFG